MDYNGPIDFDKLFPTPEDGEDFDLSTLLRGLTESIKTVLAAAEQVVQDALSGPMGTYCLMTGPSPVRGGYETYIGFDRNDGKKVGPITIQRYETKEESDAGHKEWRNLICSAPPVIIKDIDHDRIVNLLMEKGF